MKELRPSGPRTLGRRRIEVGRGVLNSTFEHGRRSISVNSPFRGQASEDKMPLATRMFTTGYVHQLPQFFTKNSFAATLYPTRRHFDYALLNKFSSQMLPFGVSIHSRVIHAVKLLFAQHSTRHTGALAVLLDSSNIHSRYQIACTCPLILQQYA